MPRLAAVIALGMATQALAQQTSAPEAPAMVFFDWGKPDIRSDDHATLAPAASA